MTNPSYSERLQLHATKVAERNRHEAAWESLLADQGHHSDRWWGTYLDSTGELRYGQIVRDWPECELDELHETGLAFWEATQA